MSTLIGRALALNYFGADGGSVPLEELVRDLPETNPVSENGQSVVLTYRDNDYIRQKGWRMASISEGTIMKPLDAPRYKFCPMCGHPLVTKRPLDDVRVREVCEACGFVRLCKPDTGWLEHCRFSVVVFSTVVGVPLNLVKENGHCRPGFMEAHETLQQGALRETWEETGAHARAGMLLTVIDVPYASQVHFFFLSELDALPLAPGPETMEQRLFSESEIPWDDISFTTVKTTLEHYFNDRRKGEFRLHMYRLDE